jgi:hypothetical protein
MVATLKLTFWREGKSSFRGNSEQEESGELFRGVGVCFSHYGDPDEDPVRSVIPTSTTGGNGLSSGDPGASAYQPYLYCPLLKTAQPVHKRILRIQHYGSCYEDNFLGLTVQNVA